MHRLQCVHCDGVAGSACIRLTRSGSRSSARPIATNSKPSDIAVSIADRSVIPPSRINGIVNASRNCFAWSRKYSGFHGYSLKKVCPLIRMPALVGAFRGMRWAISLTGASPRNRYIGFINDDPPVSSRASR